VIGEMCALVVLGLVFSYQTKRLAWERLRNVQVGQVKCRVGRKTLTQSINQSR